MATSDLDMLSLWQTLLGKAVNSGYGSDIQGALSSYASSIKNPKTNEPTSVSFKNMGKAVNSGGYNPRSGNIRLDIKKLNVDAPIDAPMDFASGIGAHELRHAKENNKAGFIPMGGERNWVYPEVPYPHFRFDQPYEDVPQEGKDALWLMLKQLGEING